MWLILAECNDRLGSTGEEISVNDITVQIIEVDQYRDGVDDTVMVREKLNGPKESGAAATQVGEENM